jgi:hypothetical protein
MSQTATKSHFSWVSLAEVFRLFLFLDAEQSKILFTRRLQGQKTAPDWLHKLDLLARFDAHADNARLTSTILGTLSIILVVVCIIIDVNSYEKQAIWGTLGKIFIFLTFLSAFLYFLLKKIDLENRLRYFVYPLLKILVQEGKPNTLIDLHLELKPIKSKAYKTAVRRNKPISAFRKFTNWAALISFITFVVFVLIINLSPSKIFQEILVYPFLVLIGSLILMFFAFMFRSYPIIVTTIYTYPWLSFSARMADDTLLSVTFTDTLLHISKTRTNARGKIKTKTKETLKRVVALTIGFDKDNYIFHSQAPQNNKITGAKVVVKPNEKRHTFKIQQKQKLNTHFEPRLDLFLDLVGKAYQGMKQAS